MGLAYLRGVAEKEAIEDLMQGVDGAKFEAAFGSSVENAQALVDSKTVTINRLLEISAEGVHDPTPHLYDTTFYVAAGFIGFAAICNQLLVPPDLKELLKKAKALDVEGKEKEKRMK